ncbi:MAG: oxidoreductase [Candidatus Hydrogenedentota bacterium]
MGKRPLRVGVIGVGAIAEMRHLPYWLQLQAENRIELTAVCDIKEARARAMAAKFGVDIVYTDYQTMLKEREFDVIDVCTHNRFHAPITIAALRHGAHVLVEKPMAMSVAESKKMIAAAKSAKRKLMTAQHMRFEAPHEKLKEAAQRGELGDIYTGRAYFLRRREIPGWGVFHLKKESLGGPLIDVGVHVIDLAMWIMGFPKPVAASGKVYRKFGDRADLCNADWGEPYPPKEFDVEDYALALIRFANGATLQVDVSWAANIPKTVSGISILGDKAGVSTDPLGVYGYEKGALTCKTYDWLPDQEGHRMEIRHFTECIERNLPVRVQPEESLMVQKVIDAIYTSSKSNREIVIR